MIHAQMIQQPVIKKEMKLAMNVILEKYNNVNAFGKQMGFELHTIKPGKVEYRLKITENHLSNPMAVHGGVIAAMMDGILGVACLSLSVESQRLTSTVEFKLNYYAPIKPGDQLLGIGEVVFEGNKLMSSEGTIYCENRDMLVVCKGLGTFNTYPIEKNELFNG